MLSILDPWTKTNRVMISGMEVKKYTRERYGKMCGMQL